MSNNLVIKFEKKSDDLMYNPPKSKNTYYQICQFKNKFTNKYGVRKIYYNEHGEIIKNIIKEYTKKEIDKFIKLNKTTKYSIYPLDDAVKIELPGAGDLICMKSELLR
jgi:hypothetical protein